MKTLFILLVLNLGFGQLVKADTISYWHVYCNDIKIKEFNQYSKGSIVLKKSEIKPTDSLTIKYFRDTPSFDCQTILAITNQKEIVIVADFGKGTFCPLTISLSKILNAYLKKNEVYSTYYIENPRSSYRVKELLFEITFE